MKKSLEEIKSEIGVWANRNFKPKGRMPEFGVLEEIGEAAHCYLKRMQGIRGFEDSAHFKSQLTDAIADVGIYLLHYCFMHNITVTYGDQRLEDSSYANAFKVAAKASSNLINSDDAVLRNVSVNRLFSALGSLASQIGVSVTAVIRETWDKVAQRDWVQNPTDANKKAGDSEPGIQESNQEDRTKLGDKSTGKLPGETSDNSQNSDAEVVAKMGGRPQL